MRAGRMGRMAAGLGLGMALAIGTGSVGTGTPAVSSPVVRAARGVWVNNANTVAAPLPTGSAAGDTCVVGVGHGFAITTVSAGWDMIDNLAGSVFNGASLIKVLTAADITAGTVTINFAGTYYGTVELVTFVGTVGLRTFVTARNSTGASSRILTTDSSPQVGDVAIWFIGGRASVFVSCNGGSELQHSFNTEASSCINAQTISVAGVNSATFTFGSPTPSGDYQMCVVLKAGKTEEYASTAYFKAMTAQPTAPRKTLIDTLIAGLKTDGIWDKLDWLCLLASHDSQSALLNAARPSKAMTSAGTFTVDRGYVSAAIPELFSATGNKFVQNSAVIGTWCNLQGTGTLKPQIGNAGLVGSSFTNNYARNDAGNETFMICDQTADTFQANTGSRVGHRTITRTASNVKRAFMNGVRTANLATASTGVGGFNGALNRDEQTTSDDRYNCFYAGSGLADADVVNIHSRLNTYLTAISANAGGSVGVPVVSGGIANVSPGWNGWAFRQRLNAALLVDAVGGHVRLTIRSGTSVGLVVGEAWIGKAGAGAFDFDGAQVPVTFNGGSAGASIAANADLVSDPIALAYTGTDDLMIFYYFSGATDITFYPQANASNQQKNGNDHGATASVGYSGSAFSNAFKLVEVLA